MSNFCVYILYSESLDKYYVGQTEDLGVRILFHNHPIESRKFTAKGIPWSLKISLACESKDHALRLESFIKKMKSRKFIERLIIDPQLRNDIIKRTST
jgi:putative endonuclease